MSIIEKLVADFQIAMNAPIEEEIIKETDEFLAYLPKLGLPQSNVDAWHIHRRRLRNTYRFIEDTLAERRVDSILDIGANVVFVPMWRKIRPDARLIFGIDPGQADLLRVHGEEIECYCGDFESDPIPLQDESVDIVTLFEVFEHLYVDPMFLIEEVNRVLKPDGLFLISSPNSCSWRACLASLTHYHPYQYAAFAGLGSRRHVHEPAPRDLHLALVAGGFEPKTTTLNNFSPYIPSSFDRFFESIGAGTGLRGDTVMAVGVKTGPTRERYPRELYDVPAMAGK